MLNYQVLCYSIWCFPVVNPVTVVKIRSNLPKLFLRIIQFKNKKIKLGYYHISNRANLVVFVNLELLAKPLSRESINGFSPTPMVKVLISLEIKIFFRYLFLLCFSPFQLSFSQFSVIGYSYFIAINASNLDSMLNNFCFCFDIYILQDESELQNQFSSGIKVPFSLDKIFNPLMSVSFFPMSV